MKSPNYTCVRCGMNSKYKKDVHNHLYNRKKICPALENDIELTDEVKEYILLNRIYRVKVEPNITFNTQIINNNNIMNNTINNMNDIEKIEKHFNHKDIQLKPLFTLCDEKYSRDIKKLQKANGNLTHCLSKEELYDTIEKIVKINDLDDIFYVIDSKSNSLILYDDSGWELKRLLPGIKIILNTIKDSYLDIYEKYLIRNIETGRITPRGVSICKENLEIYYKFIISLEFLPYVYDQCSCNILDKIDCICNESNFDLCDEYMKLYKDVKINMKQSEINKTIREIIELIKHNYKNNIKKLNTEILEFIRVDKNYKNMFMNQ